MGDNTREKTFSLIPVIGIGGFRNRGIMERVNILHYKKRFTLTSNL